MDTFVGIDVSKAHLDWAIHSAEQGRVTNRATGIRKLVGRLQQLGPVLVAVESTGGLLGRTLAGLLGGDVGAQRAIDLLGGLELSRYVGLQHDDIGTLGVALGVLPALAP